jgi:DNA-binding NtrC family response regulator
LRNSLEGIVVLSRKEAIDLVDLPVDIQGSAAKETGPRFRPGITLTDLEREAIQECLHHSQGNRQRTADLLGISTRTLLRKIRHYRLADPLLQTEPVPRDGVPGHRNGMPLPPQ